MEALYAEFNKRAEAAISSYSVTSVFYIICILCLWLRIIRTSRQGIWFMNFPSQIFNDTNHGYRAAILKKNYLWLLPFYMAVVTYFCNENLRRTMRTTIVSNLPKPLLPDKIKSNGKKYISRRWKYLYLSHQRTWGTKRNKKLSVIKIKCN